MSLDEATSISDVKTEDDTLNFVLERFNSAWMDNASLREKYDDWYNHYRCYRETPVDEPTNTNRSNVFIPLSYQAVETIRARYLDAFFGQKPYFRMVGREPGDDRNAELLSLFYDWQLEQAEAYKHANNAFKDMAICGVGITKIFWEKKSHIQTVMKQRLVLNTVIEDEEEEEIPDYEGIGLASVHFKDFFIDPEATSIDNARFCCEQARVSIEYLKEMEEKGIYENIDDIVKPVSPLKPDDSGHETTRIAEGKNQEADDNKGMVDIIEYWENDKVITVANKTVVIRKDENPYGFLPYIIARVNIDTAKFYGRGLIEPAESLADLTNSLFNVAMDNLNYLINHQWVYNENMILDPSELTTTPGGAIGVRGSVRDAVREIIKQPLSADFYQVLMAVIEFYNKTTGAIDLLKGVPQKGVGTATEASITAKEGISRVQMEIKTLEEEYMKPLIKKMHSMNKRFINADQVVRVTGIQEDPYEQIRVEPQYLIGDYDFTFEAASRHLSEQRDRIELQQLLQTIAGNPAMVPVSTVIVEKIMKLSGMHPDDEIRQAMESSKQLSAMMLMAQLQPKGVDNQERRPPNVESEVQKSRMRGGYS